MIEKIFKIVSYKKPLQLRLFLFWIFCFEMEKNKTLYNIEVK